jgi:hypothetical protein
VVIDAQLAREAGRLRARGGIGVFPQMRANQGGGASVMLLADSRAATGPCKTAWLPEQNRVGYADHPALASQVGTFVSRDRNVANSIASSTTSKRAMQLTGFQN